jgi:UMF1 family MFS transporter
LALLLTRASQHALFLALAGCFAIFSIPCFLFVRERPNPKARRLGWSTISESVREVLHTLKSSKDHPGLLRFLIARLFYSDAVNTVIAIMSLYVLNVAKQFGGDDAAGKHLADIILFIAITFAIGGGIFWGRVVDRFGPKRTLVTVFACWAIALTFGAAIGLFSLPIWTTYVMGAVTGIAFGGVSTADRPFLLRLAPPDRVGEYYGLYGMVGRFGAITGPVLWALVTWAATSLAGLRPLQAQGLGILVLLGMMGVGYAILRPVSDNQPVAATGSHVER